MAPHPTILMEHVTVTWPGVPEAVSGAAKRASLSPAGEAAAKRVCLAAPPPQESALFYWRCFAEERSRAYNHTFGSGLAGPDFSDIRRQAGEATVPGPPPGEEPRREPSKQRRDRSRHGSGKVRKKRTAIQAMVRPLKRWLVRHRHNPYPSREEKLQLGETAGMNLGQVSTWFANARRRLKQVVSGELLPWQERVRLYNSCVKGNAELLSLSSDDSVWNDDGGRGNENGPNPAAHGGEQLIEFSAADPAGPSDLADPADSADLADNSDPSNSADPAGHACGAVRAPASPGGGGGSPSEAGSPKYKKKMLLRYLSDTERYSSAADADDEASGGSRGDSGSSEGRPMTNGELTELRGSSATETEEPPRVSPAGPELISPAPPSRERASPSRVVPNSATQPLETEKVATAAPESATAEIAEPLIEGKSTEVPVSSSGPSISASAPSEQQKTPNRPEKTPSRPEKTPSRPEKTPSRPAKRPASDAAPRAKKRRPPSEQLDGGAVKRRLQFDEEGATKRARLSPPAGTSAPHCYPSEVVTAPLVGPTCVAPAGYPGLDLTRCQPPQQPSQHQQPTPPQQQQQQQPQRQHQQQSLHQQQWEQYPQSMTLLPWVPVWAGPAPAPYWDGVPALSEEAAYRQVALPAPPAVWECWPTPTDGRPAYLPLL